MEWNTKAHAKYLNRKSKMRKPLSHADRVGGFIVKRRLTVRDIPFTYGVEIGPHPGSNRNSERGGMIPKSWITDGGDRFAIIAL